MTFLSSATMSFGGDSRKSATPKEECEELLNWVMPFAQQMLEKNREFFPFGATLSATGKISPTAAYPGSEHPESKDVISLLEQGFRDGARRSQYKATVLVVDVRVIPPGKTSKQDAVEIRLDHRDRYSVRVIFPYAFSPAGELTFESPFAVPGDKKIFD